MEELPALKSAIQRTFGTESYIKDRLNREYLSELVFANAEQVKKLNDLVHPQVGRDFENWAQQQERDHPYVVKEAALLIESGSYKQLNHLVTVVAPEELRIARVLQRDPHRSLEQVKDIIARQLSDPERITKSQSVLYNDEKQSLVAQVIALHRSLLQ